MTWVFLAMISLAVPGGAAGTGSRSSAPPNTFLRLLWQAPLSVAGDGEGPAVLGLADGRAVVRQDEQGVLLDTSNGRVLARMALGDAPAVFAAGHLVVLEGKALVAYATDAGAFQKRWQAPVSPNALLPYGTELAYAQSGNTVLFTGAGCGARCPNASNLDRAPELVAVDAATGALRWRHRFDGREVDAVVAAGGDLFVVASRGEVIAYAAATGRLLWRTGDRKSEADDSSALAIAGEDLLFAQGGRRVMRLAVATGRRRWEVGLQGMAATALAASHGAVFLALEESARLAHPRPTAVRALDIARGRQLWQRPCNARGLILAGDETLVVEDMGPTDRGWETRLLLVDRVGGDLRDAFRVGRASGVVVEHPAAAEPRLLVGSTVGVLGLALGKNPPPSATGAIRGRVTAAGVGPLVGFPVNYEARAPGWPIRTATTDSRGEFSIDIDAPDVIPIVLDPEAVERHRRMTGGSNPRWSCMATPRFHFVLGAPAPVSGHIDTTLFCFDPLDE